MAKAGVSTTDNTAIERWFSLRKRGSTWPREIRGGLVTFVTMAYIVVLNPLIIGTAPDKDGKLVGGITDVGVAITAVAAVTALVAGVMTIAMGVFGRLPLAVAAGLGLNGVVAYSLAPQMTWADAMGIVVLEGLLILVLVLTGFRQAVFTAIPDGLKYAIGVGIGLFITVIGLVDAGIVRTGVPLISFGINGELSGWPIFTFVIGLLLTIALLARKVKGALLIGIVATTVIAIVIESVFAVGGRTEENIGGWQLSVPVIPTTIFAAPDFQLLGKFSLFGAFTAVGAIAAGLAVFSLMLTDFFDTLGTTFAIANEGDIVDKDGNVPHLESILIVDSLAAVAGGAASASSNTSYIESASGVADGARTGIAAIFTGLLFLVAMFVAPLVTIVPFEAATPALVLVGFFMMLQIKRIDFSDYSIGIPAFLTIALMPFTYSITNGIGAGFIAWTLIKVVQGKVREIPWVMWIVTLAFVLYFLVSPLEALFGLS
jgi:AGZA family xanthine/uracil permease-like MFS transporter